MVAWQQCVASAACETICAVCSCLPNSAVNLGVSATLSLPCGGDLGFFKEIEEPAELVIVLQIEIKALEKRKCVPPPVLPQARPGQLGCEARTCSTCGQRLHRIDSQYFSKLTAGSTGRPMLSMLTPRALPSLPLALSSSASHVSTLRHATSRHKERALSHGLYLQHSRPPAHLAKLL